ncbi:MAG TPA: protein kinase, partial [Pyrinomonadaceae bacterium]
LSGEVDQTAPPSPFDPPVVERKTAPTLEDIPTPSILSSGTARPTDPDISFAAESTPTKESPVFDEDSSVEINEESAEQAPSVDETSQAEQQVTEIPVFAPVDEGSEDSSIAHADDTVLPGKPDTQTPAPADVEEPKVPTFDLGPSPVASQQAQVSEAADPKPPEPPQPATSREQDESPLNAEATLYSDVDFSVAPADEPQPDSVKEAESLGISRPLQELEEPAQSPSMFDSVRIMEDEPPPADSVDTIIAGQQRPRQESPEDRSEASSERSPVSGRMSVSTGIGVGDTDGRKAAKLKPLPEGTVLNSRYEIVRKIGGGGMGAVYLASDNNLGGVLRAVKEMVQAHIEEDQQEKAINDFKRESMILSTLDHPSIPTIYDYFYDAEEGRFYLVMKYISGGDLASKLRSSPDGKIEELIVTEWAIQLTDVLNYLHNQPSTIVYRDLKPSNIMLDGNSGRVMLIDFGIARNISQKEEKGVTAVGTMGYAPPELFSGNVEPRSDIYSLGSTMFHLLTGADPQSNPLLIFDFQKNPRPRQINSRLSDQMERILMRTVEYNADQRFSSAAELKAVLEDHIANLKSGNLTYGVTEVPTSVSLANQSVFCGFCGQRIVATDMFCAFCGAKQPIAQQGVHAEIYQSKPAATARLVIEGTSELSAPIYALQKDDNLIGRRDPMSNIFPEVDLSKYDPQTKISRRHAKIWRDGTSFMLEDLGSSNGTVIEGAAASIFKLPAHQPYKLSSGDRIKIGDTRLHFVVG